MAKIDPRDKTCKWQGNVDGCGNETWCVCDGYAEGVRCEHQEFDYNPDGTINMVTGKCFVEKKKFACDNYYRGYCCKYEDGCFWQCEKERNK